MPGATTEIQTVDTKPIPVDKAKLSIAIEQSVWTANVLKVSEVDSSGYIEVIVDYLQDGEIVYSSVVISGTPDVVIKNVQSKGQELKLKNVQAVQIQVGDVISI